MRTTLWSSLFNVFFIWIIPMNIPENWILSTKGVDGRSVARQRRREELRGRGNKTGATSAKKSWLVNAHWPIIYRWPHQKFAKWPSPCGFFGKKFEICMGFDCFLESARSISCLDFNWSVVKTHPIFIISDSIQGVTYVSISAIQAEK